jgi:hypothetical protein
MDATEYFVRLFEKVSTIDSTPYLCVPKALEFRQEVCGGEDAVRQYSEGIAADGGKCMAELLGTEVLPTSPSQACCFTNVRLPLRVNGDQGRRIAKWMQESTAPEYETYLPIKFYEGGFWCRLSGQIYLTMEDFEWAAKVLLELSDRARAGEWKTGD